MDGFTEAIERLISEMKAALNKHTMMFDGGFLDIYEKELMDENTKLCFKTKKSALFAEININDTDRVCNGASSSSSTSGSSSKAQQGGLHTFAQGRWAQCTPAFSSPKMDIGMENAMKIPYDSLKRTAASSNSAGADSDVGESAQHAKRQRIYDTEEHINIEQLVKSEEEEGPKPSSTVSRATPRWKGPAKLAKNGLPRSYVGWRKAKGMKDHMGMRVFVNPDGRPYKARDNPVLGEDFFVTAEDVVAYVEKRKAEQPNRTGCAESDQDGARAGEQGGGAFSDEESSSGESESDLEEDGVSAPSSSSKQRLKHEQKQEKEQEQEQVKVEAHHHNKSPVAVAGAPFSGRFTYEQMFEMVKQDTNQKLATTAAPAQASMASAASPAPATSAAGAGLGTVALFNVASAVASPISRPADGASPVPRPSAKVGSVPQLNHPHTAVIKAEPTARW